MSGVFLKVLNMSITASWLILAAVVLRLFLKKAPKWITCLLWALVALRLVCPFTFESVLSLIPTKEPVPTNIVMSQKPTVEVGIPAIDTSVNTVIAENFTPAAGDSVNPLQIVVPVLAVVWIAGIITLIGYAFISYLKLRKTVSVSFELQKGVRACDDVKAPFILGILRPVIYVPSSMESATLDYVLKHEKAHLARRDHWWKPFGFLLLAVYWFNPLSWLAYVLLCRDIESACDERVIRDMDKPSMAAYSQALLDCSFSRRTIAACPLAFGEVGVKERIKGVLNYKKPAFWVIVVALIACVVVSICFLTNPKDDGQDYSLLNYKSALTIDWNIRITAVHSGTDDNGNTFTEMLPPDKEISKESLANYLDKATWKKCKTPSETLASSDSVEIRIYDNYTITVYKNPKIARVVSENDERYYKTGSNDYALALELYNTALPLPASFIARVTEISNGTMYVRPEDGEEELASADKIAISLNDDGNVYGDYMPKKGDRVSIEYNGYIYETYPATLGEVSSVRYISPSLEDAAMLAKPVKTPWIDPNVLLSECTNSGKVLISPDRHLPVIKFESKEEWNSFVEKYDDIIDFDGSDFGDAPLFNYRIKTDGDPFEEYLALLIYVESPSRSFTYNIGDIEFPNDTMIVHIVESPRPEVYTDDMSGYFLTMTLKRSEFANVEAYDAVLGSEPETPDIVQAPAYELADFETETVISSFNCDLTHDGIKDIAQVSFITTDEFDGVIGDTMFKYGLMGFVKVYDGSKGEPSDSSLIWYHDYGLAHAGNYQFFITQKEGKDYLVQTSLISGQGSNSYEYSVLTFDNANQASVDEQLLTFNDGEKADKAGFFDSLYEWINDDSVLLMAADLEIDRYIYSTNDNIVNPDEYYHRRMSQY